jgi:hypothetical protein
MFLSQAEICAVHQILLVLPPNLEFGGICNGSMKPDISILP